MSNTTVDYAAKYFGGKDKARSIICKALRRARLFHLMSRYQLSQRSGVSVDQIKDVEKGNHFTRELLQQLSFPLGVMPNKVLSPKMTLDNLKEVQKIMMTVGAGNSFAGGIEGKPPADEEEQDEVQPTPDECRSFIVLRVLQEMDES